MVLISLTAYADLPLTVENLLADKNRFKLDTSLSYYNHHKVAATAQDFDSIDMGNGCIIYIPSVGNSHSNTDSLIAGLGLRYGVSDKFELGIKTSGIYNAARHQMPIILPIPATPIYKMSVSPANTKPPKIINPCQTVSYLAKYQFMTTPKDCVQKAARLP